MNHKELVEDFLVWTTVDTNESFRAAASKIRTLRSALTAYYDLQKELVVAWRHLETTRHNRDRIEKTDYRLK